MARYRLYETCFGVKIDIIYNDELIAEAPYIIEGKYDFFRVYNRNRLLYLFILLLILIIYFIITINILFILLLLIFYLFYY